MAQSLPAAPQPVPGLPENAEVYEFAGWDGIDTKPTRAGVDDRHAAWMDNLMPLGPNNIVSLNDRQPDALYSGPSKGSILWHAWFRIATTPSSAIVFLTGGSAVQVARVGGAVKTIAPAGTFAPQAGTFPYAFQFGSKYLIIVSEQTNGYWVWDGTNLYGAGSIGPVIDITNGGKGYNSAPTVTAIGGSGSGVSLQAVVNAGVVTNVNVLNPGHGYLLFETPFLQFSGGGGGTTAYGTANLSDGVIITADLTDGGGGYTSLPSVNISDSTGSGATIAITGASGGILTGLRVVSGGSGYTAPTISFSGGAGSGAAGTLSIASGVITGVTMVDGGSGYLGLPIGVIVTEGATEGTGGQITGIVNNTNVSGGKVLSGGSAYNGTVYVYFTGAGGPAVGVAQLMPFGIQGSSGDENNSRVWVSSVGNGTPAMPAKIVFSAPGEAAVQDYSVGNGAGAFPPTDSHLQYQYTAIKSAAGEFLYLVGDSSVDVESGAQSSGSPLTTTFSKVNVDEQNGTVWRDTVINYGRAIVFANFIGVHTILGGAVSKISTPLDGVYFAGAFGSVAPGFLPSSAVADVNNVRCYILLGAATDPLTNQIRSILFMWDAKRWWTCTPSTNMTQVSTREDDSVCEAWGSDGTSIFKLFTTPATIPKTLVAKLWMKPSIFTLKRAIFFYALYINGSATPLNFSVDSEEASLPIAPLNANSVPVSPFGQTNGVGWARGKTPGLGGHSLGFRMTTTTPSCTLIDMTLVGQTYRMET